MRPRHGLAGAVAMALAMGSPAANSQVLFPVNQCQNPVMGDCFAAQKNWNKTYRNYYNCPVPDQVYACWGPDRVSFSLCKGPRKLNFVLMHNAFVAAFHRAVADGKLVGQDKVSRAWEHFNAFSTDLGYAIGKKASIEADYRALDEHDISTLAELLKTYLDKPSDVTAIVETLYENLDQCGYLGKLDADKVQLVRDMVAAYFGK